MQISERGNQILHLKQQLDVLSFSSRKWQKARGDAPASDMVRIWEDGMI